MPELLPQVRADGLKGKVTAQLKRVDGRVTHALIQNSTLPEMNAAVVTAIRQWEFPSRVSEADKRPLRASLVFDFTQAASTANGNSSLSN
jgi:hypothetical protein